MRIVNCIATPTTLIISFSQPLDPSPDPTQITHYTVKSTGGASFTPTPPAVYDAFNNAIILQFPSANLLPRGQWIVVTASGVNSGGVAIANGGNDTFTTQVNGDGGRNGRRREVQEITESVEDAVSYPLLTEQVSFPPTAGGGPAAGAVAPVPAGAALGQVAAKAVTDVLGWKVNTADPKGFIGALTQSFTLTDVEGHTEATWNPRTYAVQTDLGGGITGAQASLYTRARDALDKALPLLDGLYPLDPDADPEFVKGLREMARSQMTEIVKELGATGGPSVLRVNTYFGILLGTGQTNVPPGSQTTPVVFDPDQVQGTLGELRQTYGIYFQNNPFSNSIQDEQDITNFRVISDYMTSLLQSWNSNGQFFLLGTKTPNFFGTQLVLISRQFSVITETVNEVRFALDSVFIGPSERQTLLLQFRDPTLPAIFLEDMLTEIESFNAEASRLLQDGGRISVTNNILPVARSFQHMVDQSRRPTNIGDLPDGFRTVRVRRTLDDLNDQLKELINLVQTVQQQVVPPVQVPEPLQVLFVTPGNAAPSAVPLTVTIVGTGFEELATCAFIFAPPARGAAGAGTPTPPTISVSPPFVTENLLFAQVLITGGTSGFTYSYDVTVTNPDGNSATLSGRFTVTVP